MKVAYVRVSTVEQNEARQIEALEKYGIEKWFTEKISGKDTNRPELQEMLDYVREGDTVYIKDFSRLARSTKDLLEIVNQLQAKKVHLVSDKENLDTSTATGILMLTVIGAINEFERANILERQKEGIAIAKRNGKYRGRKPVEVEDEVFKDNYTKYMNREITKCEFAETIKVSRPTLDKMLKEYKPA
jgi:DNA invertase Pin-like site-specific DNA recombinase